jgi:hypothetical protein
LPALDSRFRAGLSGENRGSTFAAKFAPRNPLFYPLPPPAGGLSGENFAARSWMTLRCPYNFLSPWPGLSRPSMSSPLTPSNGKKAWMPGASPAKGDRTLCKQRYAQPPSVPRTALHRPGGEGTVRGAAEPVCGAAHLTLPGPTGRARGLAADVAPRPLPLPPKGRRGALSRTRAGRRQHSRLSEAVVLQPLSIPPTALRSRGNDEKERQLVEVFGLIVGQAPRGRRRCFPPSPHGLVRLTKGQLPRYSRSVFSFRRDGVMGLFLVLFGRRASWERPSRIIPGSAKLIPV